MVASAAGGIPFGFAPGNHDVAGNITLYEKYFGATRFASRPYYGGHYNTDNRNSYDLFSASGMNFMVINIDCSATPAAGPLAWADALLKANSNRRSIVVCHDLLTSGNAFTSAGSAVYEALKGNPNLFLMLGGHLDTEGQKTDTFNGSTIYSFSATSGR